ncbi:enhancer of split malpha protein [Diabrotica virgifera virgifera]|uniref:Enhancer of split malpha protein-like n=1 Tax=Diabrotica virgifera virgifera TaxID=50390 RepID=A0A6P7FAP4_DIAVI|nr:enhancer of split malpha protein [Diabrotica virgifera virgifera]
MSLYDAEVFNNSVNDNKVNDKKSKSTMHQIKKLIKCIIKKNKHTYVKNPQPDYYFDEEISDNLANEILENEIFEDIDNCEDFSAVPVYENGEMDFLPVTRGQRYIPVHFARTEAGTFFWTSITTPDQDICYHGDKNAISNYQVPQRQVPNDRWAQA